MFRFTADTKNGYILDGFRELNHCLTLYQIKIISFILIYQYENKNQELFEIDKII